jgi:hypothetical protein
MNPGTAEADFTVAEAASALDNVRELLRQKSPPARKATPKSTPVAGEAKPKAAGRPGLYAAVCLAIAVAGSAAVYAANPRFAPEMYDEEGMRPAAEALSQGKNYAVFDLNMNIRKLRDFQVSQMSEAPDIVIYGASHWQEANASLVPYKKMYNAHIHRDFWEDPLAIADILTKYNKLPKQIIISVRDNQFRPVELRPDYLWEPGIPYYREMADRLGLEKESAWKTFAWHRLREKFSLSMLFTNVTRWYNASDFNRPHPTTEYRHKSLDTLLPDGSIVWSEDHLKIFTPERTKTEALKLANLRKNDPPPVDPKGVEAFRALLAFYKEKGVEVILTHPPFNPTYYDAIKGTPYEAGLHDIEKLTDGIAKEFGLKQFGSYNPADVGCVSSEFIDAEHSNMTCLRKVFAQFVAMDRPDDLKGTEGLN